MEETKKVLVVDDQQDDVKERILALKDQERAADLPHCVILPSEVTPWHSARSS